MSRNPRVKAPPTADDLRDMMLSIETLEDALERIRDGVRDYDLVSVPGIGEAGSMVLNQEIDRARSAIEWLGIIIGDAEDAMDGAATAETP